MSILRYVWIYIRNLCIPLGTSQTNIDSHKWESKVEIYRMLSGR